MIKISMQLEPKDLRKVVPDVPARHERVRQVVHVDPIIPTSGPALVQYLVDELERRSRPRINLFFQHRPYAAWVLRVTCESEAIVANARTWFDDHRNSGRAPRPDIVEPAAQHLRKVVRAAILYAEEPERE